MRTLISVILALVGFVIFLAGMTLMFSALSGDTDRSTEGWAMLGALLSGVVALVGAGIALIGYRLNSRKIKAVASPGSE